jgi:MoxR-like ATPase
MMLPMSRLVVAEEVRSVAETIDRLERNVARVIRGKAGAIRNCVLALLARGHLLVEDVPGVGKTTLARSLAASIGGTFHRIQFTSDLLPSDIVGVSVLAVATLFANVVLADEINRTTPRTQSALLEAMNDGQVTVDGVSHALGQPFLVVATQNPEEHYGTYPLPESQMDRFALRIRLDYPTAEVERSLLLEAPALTEDALAMLSPVVSLAA